MTDKDLYSLKEIHIAFSRYFRGGNGVFQFNDSWTESQGSIQVSWKSFLEELEKARKARISE